MSLFPSANDFKSGPGVEKDAPRKTGVAASSSWWDE